MNKIAGSARAGVTVLRLVGEVGHDRACDVQAALEKALRAAGGRVLLDLRATRHLHYRVARLLVETARARRGLCLVGPSPYVRQILRLVGTVEGEVPEYRNFGDALGAAAA